MRTWKRGLAVETIGDNGFKLGVEKTCTCDRRLRYPGDGDHKMAAKGPLFTTVRRPTWALTNIAWNLVRLLLDNGRFQVLQPDCQRFDKNGRSDWVICNCCGQPKDLASIVFFEPAGEPFKAYTCLRCRLEQADPPLQDMGITRIKFYDTLKS